MVHTLSQNPDAKLRTLAIGALGVVYGDIGTSPLYTLKQVFTGGHQLPVNELNILGGLSIIFWSLIIVMCLKYMIFILSADNNGEGGVIALTALALRGLKESQQKYMLIMGLGILAAGLFYGDSVITPAMSVLGAIEGLQVAAPNLKFLIIPITVIILVLLFSYQRKGTAHLGKYFGLIMILWFLTIGCLGIIAIVKNPSVIRALNPYYAVMFFIENKGLGFIVLGASFLALTGAEAVYADLGHFGPKPIRAAWFLFVMPALLCNYFGQGALLLQDPAGIDNPFYLLAPQWALYPLLILAATATIIASQAVISGTFSMTQEAIRLGYLPRLEVHHTSEDEKGQIYIPAVNWGLFAIVILVVLEFGSTDKLGPAYGLSVSGTMVITTLLAFSVIQRIWAMAWWKVAVAFGFFLAVDTVFMSANLIKFMEGGWLPVSIAFGVFILMMTWFKGARCLADTLGEEVIPLDGFIDKIGGKKITTVKGTGVFLTSDPHSVPRALLHNLQHNKVMHERIAIVQIKTEDRPHVPVSERVKVQSLPRNFYVINVNYGFKDTYDVPEALRLCGTKGVDFSILDTTYFVGRENLVCSDVVDMPVWSKLLFIGMFQSAGSFTNYCNIPSNSLVELGVQVEF